MSITKEQTLDLFCSEQNYDSATGETKQQFLTRKKNEIGDQWALDIVINRIRGDKQRAIEATQTEIINVQL